MPDYQQFLLWVLDVIFLLLRCHIYLSCNTPAFAIHYLRGYSLLLQAVFPFPTQFLVVSSRFSGSSKEHMMVSLIFTCEQVWNEIWAAHAGWFPPQSPTCASRPRSLWQALWNLLVSPVQVIFTLPKCREKKIKKKEKNISSSEGRTTSETALGTSGAARLENCFVTSSKQIHLSLSKAPLLPHGDNSTPEATKRNSKIPVKDTQLVRQLQKIHSASEGISHTQHLEPGLWKAAHGCLSTGSAGWLLPHR